MISMLELFTGCGGLAQGMANAGFSHRAFVEINPWACASLRKNFPANLVHETDARTFDFKDVGKIDVIAGGPPCQPFSLGGKSRAYLDQRDMFPQAIRAISELAPCAFVFENVKGLLRKSFAEYFDYIIQRLTFPTFQKQFKETWRDHLERLRKVTFPSYDGLKYRVCYKLLNAADYGVPQIRERVFVIGIRSDVNAQWTWPSPVCKKCEWKTIREALAGLGDPQEPGQYSDHVFIDGAHPYPGHTGSDIDKPSKTIKAGAHGVPGGENMIRFPDGSVRYFTVHEAKRIQTFPDTYQIEGSWGEALRQIGNAVPVRLAEVIGRRLFSILSFPKAESARKALLYRTEGDCYGYLFEKREAPYSGKPVHKKR